MGAARRGRGFNSLGTIDRIAYGNYEPLIALAAAAAVTERIGLSTSVLLGPLRENAVALAKQALSIHALSGGRMTLGIGLGGRDDDYEISGLETAAASASTRCWRGSARSGMTSGSAQVEVAPACWSAAPSTPRSPAPPALATAGSPAARRRTSSPKGPRRRGAWSEAGREGEPRLMGLAYFALGDNAEADAKAYLTDYYAWLGEETANFIAGSAAKDAETVRQYVAAFDDAGCGELILFPSSSDPAQVDLLADAAGL